MADTTMPEDIAALLERLKVACPWCRGSGFKGECLGCSGAGFLTPPAAAELARLAAAARAEVADFREAAVSMFETNAEWHRNVLNESERRQAAEAEAARLRSALEGRDKALALLNAGMESTCEDRDRLKQEARGAAAEVARLKADLAVADAGWDRAAATRDDLARELAAVRGRVAQLEAALRPFAEYARQMDENRHDNSLRIGYYETSPTVGDCRAAAAALRPGTEEDKGK